MAYRRKELEDAQAWLEALSESERIEVYRTATRGCKRPQHVSEELWNRVVILTFAGVADLVDDLEDTVKTSGNLIQSLLADNRKLRKQVYMK